MASADVPGWLGWVLVAGCFCATLGFLSLVLVLRHLLDVTKRAQVSQVSAMNALVGARFLDAGQPALAAQALHRENTTADPVPLGWPPDMPHPDPMGSYVTS